MAEIDTGRPLPFVKMSGSGNDFIIVDHRREFLGSMDLSELARRVCDRHRSVGADGLILIEESGKADFRWQFFNADGSRAEMCGNGARCAARLAHMEGIAPAEMRFETEAGLLAAKVSGRMVKIQMTRPFGFEDGIGLELEKTSLEASFVNTGVPHTVIIADDVRKVDVVGLGRAIRFHERFQPAGANADFITITDRRRLIMRTYERGVEGETEACGTGAVASALVTWMKGLTDSVVMVKTSGGEELTIYIEPEEGKEYPTVYLEGKTIFICRGSIDPEGFS